MTATLARVLRTGLCAPVARPLQGGVMAADTPEVTNEIVKTMLKVNRRPVIVRMWDVEPDEVGFLKRQDIPGGKRTVLEGEPRPGRTSRAVNIATAIARGWPPLGEGSEAASHVEGGALGTAFVLRIADFDAYLSSCHE